MTEPTGALERAWSLLNQRRPDEALAVLREHLAGAPGDAAAHALAARVHATHRRFDMALPHLRTARALSPGSDEIAYSLGAAAANAGLFDEACAAYEGALAINPRLAAAADDLAKCHLALDRPEAAHGVYERLFAADPGFEESYFLAGLTYLMVGMIDRAAAACERGLERLPGSTRLMQVLAMALNFRGPDTAAELALFRRFGAALTPAGGTPPAPARDKKRALTVGFVSGDFREHVCSLFLLPLMIHADRSVLRPVCYMTSQKSDGVTAQFASLCTLRDVSRESDEALAAMVAADGVDVLIDCSGLTEGHRLGVFARRAAPLQATYLGYPNTTGVPRMDLRIVDAVTDPPGAEAAMTERPLRLPRCFLCFAPLSASPETVLTPAVRKPNAPVVFGCFSRVAKLSPACLSVFAAVLARTPGSRLILKSQVATPGIVASILPYFRAKGVDASRVELRPFAPGVVDHLRTYHEVDIALDSFPYNGTTTTCEASWMGVPVVTREGAAHRARVGASLLGALGLKELVGRDDDHMVQIAAGLARDRARLRALKSGLRERMARSPLTDGPGFARDFAAALLGAWNGE